MITRVSLSLKCFRRLHFPGVLMRLVSFGFLDARDPISHCASSSTPWITIPEHISRNGCTRNTKNTYIWRVYILRYRRLLNSPYTSNSQNHLISSLSFPWVVSYLLPHSRSIPSSSISAYISNVNVPNPSFNHHVLLKHYHSSHPPLHPDSRYTGSSLPRLSWSNRTSISSQPSRQRRGRYFRRSIPNHFLLPRFNSNQCPHSMLSIRRSFSLCDFSTYPFDSR